MNHQYIVVDGAVAFYVALNETNSCIGWLYMYNEQAISWQEGNISAPKHQTPIDQHSFLVQAIL